MRANSGAHIVSGWGGAEVSLNDKIMEEGVGGRDVKIKGRMGGLCATVKWIGVRSQSIRVMELGWGWTRFYGHGEG